MSPIALSSSLRSASVIAASAASAVGKWRSLGACAVLPPACGTGVGWVGVCASATNARLDAATSASRSCSSLLIDGLHHRVVRHRLRADRRRLRDDRHHHHELRRRATARGSSHKLVPAGDDKMLVEVGTTGFKMPIPIVKDADGWRFDIEAGHKEMIARQIGANELYVIQTLMAIVDAQFDYAALQADKTGSASYARRLLSSLGKQDGLYWETKPGEPDSPLGPLVAKAQPGDREGEGYHGYHYRLLYGQGPDAPGGAYSYLVNGRMIGGFGVIAWPVKYGETGVMTFIVNQTGDVYENDFGPDTAQDVGQISLYNPDKDWEKSDTVPP
jgi:hypothetical protein